jgi:cytochrome c peroxidase
MVASGAAGAVAIGDALAGCPSDPSVLVLRLDAVWCGTCRGYAGNSKTLLASDVGAHVRLFDVLLYDQDNAPASARDAESWHQLEDVPTEIAVDSSLSVAGLLPSSTQLPVIVVVNARTMTIQASLSNPTEDALEQAIRVVLAPTADDAGGDAAIPAPPAPVPPVLTDGRFSRDQWNLISQMALTSPPPPDPSNVYADSIPAAAIGGKLFSDTRLSPSGMVDCAGCHSPLRQLTDGFPTSADGVGRVTRNSPSLTFAAYIPWAFYDGRADSLWSQALGPIEASNEFGSDRLFVAHAIYDYYRPQYEAVFGAMPPLDDTTRFPPDGMPGQATWIGMATADQVAVTQVFVNIGKSFEAFERTFRGAGASLDAYASGQLSALSDDQKDGLLDFLQAGCAQCHYGPRLTDDSFHVLRFPGGSLEAGGDPGRQAGIPQYIASEFDLGSSWSDDTSLARPAPVAGAWTLGAFKTPQLRNVALTEPYGHGGNYANLSDVVEVIRTGGLPAGSPLTTGTTEPWVVTFPQAYDGPITTFLTSLDMLFTH